MGPTKLRIVDSAIIPSNHVASAGDYRNCQPHPPCSRSSRRCRRRRCPFGGTRSRPDNEVLCMLGLGVYATYLFIDLRTPLTDCKIVVAAVTDLSDCKTAQDVADILAPKENGLIGFEGSSIFIPALVLRNAILASGSGKISILN